VEKIVIKNAEYQKDGAITGKAVLDGKTTIFVWRKSDTHPLAESFRTALLEFAEEGGIIAEYVPSESEVLTDEKTELLKLLSDTDYKAIKAAEAGLTIAEKYPELAEQRQVARDRINAIDERLTELAGDKNE
jgi:fumarylacetoacetate (FAA) hydrolase family protein